MAGREVKVAVVDGRKRLIINGRLLQTKGDVQRRIDRLDRLIESDLPAFRRALDAAALLRQARERVDRRIQGLSAERDELAGVVDQLDD